MDHIKNLLKNILFEVFHDVIGDKWLANKLAEIQRRIDQCANEEPPKYLD